MSSKLQLLGGTYADKRQRSQRSHCQTLAQTIVMLAKQGERHPVRLEQRAIEIMSG